MIKVEIVRNPATRGYDIWVTRDELDGRVSAAGPIELVFSPSVPDAYESPTLQFSGRQADEFLSSFATALALSGFKSDELKNVNQEIAAIKYHLEDMRTLVFKPE